MTAEDMESKFAFAGMNHAKASQDVDSCDRLAQVGVPDLFTAYQRSHPSISLSRGFAMKQLVLATAAILACGLASAAPTAAGHGKVVAPMATAAGTIYSQNGTDSGIGIVSQNFESSFDIYDARAADDFKVTKATASEVDVTGVYFNGAGLAVSENVTYYKTKKGLPGKLIKDYPGLSGTDSGTGSFTIKHPKTALKGQVWASVQANMDFSVGGEWGWENQTTVVGSPAAWINPGDGFATGCTKYTAETTCIPDGQGDHMFTVKGKGH